MGTSPRVGKTLLTLVRACSMVAAISAARPTWRPADRSVPWVMMMPATPRAMMTRTEDWVRMLLRLVRLRKEGSLITMIMSNTSNTT